MWPDMIMEEGSGSTAGLDGCVLERGQGTLSRVYTLSAYVGKGNKVKIVDDASPTGFGIYVSINGALVEHAFGPIRRLD